MNRELHQHDISDSAYEKIKPHTIEKMFIADFDAGEIKEFGKIFQPR